MFSDSTLSLAFSMRNNPGVYALLLGAGISQSVGIPTGWEITQDLIRQIKEVDGRELSEDSSYSELLNLIGRTQAARTSIFQNYFEPTEDEREQGLKVPSAAHRAIAMLIKDGYIKVVVTTNFDRLLEIALQDIGITPFVASSDDMLQGIPPIRHSHITIIKLHGDYRDIRTLNTAEELDSYSSEKNNLLDDIFSEYGLIVCGWSARWDRALRDAIYRITPRWYSTYWIDLNEPSNEAKEVNNHRTADVIIKDADTFFVELQSKVEALAKLDQPHPISVKVAIKRTEKLIDLGYQAELGDLIRTEADKAYKKFSELDVSKISSYEACFKEAIVINETILSILFTLCLYGKGEQALCIKNILTQWATPTSPYDDRHEHNWKRMPALLLIYICGIVSLYEGNWIYLRTVLLDAEAISFNTQERRPILYIVNKRRTFNSPDSGSSILRVHLRPILQTYIPVDREFNDLFDLFEMVMALICFKQTDKWSLITRDAALLSYDDPNKWGYIAKFWEDGGGQRENWGFLREFFGGKDKSLREILAKYDSTVKQFNHQIPSYRDSYERTFMRSSMGSL